ncbi:FAD-dependent monooxygenase [Nocardiopsis sp. HNM0947]|uniref:FAD-dependent monooxygenase n=1 Tax=Nocardiopsis coralli TaxID=2772213 RepID=A0ABR9P8S6_9ACTN|nr:FAD-dependent monooxygenase [Nocardiopsis coralli]MBE3000247.1 FAD-dependent monooxygenase [Nocardiopsis coralli]
MTAVRTVLVSGASIAGPTLAHWLHRHGIRATVVERAPGPRPGGYAIDLRGKALDVVERMGHLTEVRDHVTEMRSGTMVDGRGRRRAGFDTGVLSAEERSVELLRGDLVRILHGPTTEYTEYLYDDSVTGIEQDSDGVHVTFEKAEPRTFDLVVGADGLHSNTRGLAFGPEEPMARFLGAYISIFTVPDHLGLDREARLYNTPGKLVGMYRTPRAEGAKAIFVLQTDGGSGAERRSPAEQQRYLREAFTGNGWESDRLLQAMEDTEDFYFDSITQIRTDRWSNGRVALLGDAGYCPSPLSGQGSSLAVVGAYVLAEELARHTEVAGALDSYETRLRPYVLANQDIAGSGMGFLAPRTRFGIAARDLLVRLSPLIRSLGTFTGKLERAAEAVDLDTPAPGARSRHA